MASTHHVPRRRRGEQQFAWFGIGLAAQAIFAAAAAAAVPGPLLLGASALTQSGTGTIKGRLVWGDEKIPEPKVDVEKGKAVKSPEICAKDAPIMSRDLVVDAQSKGVAYGIAYLVKPKGDSTEQVRKLLAKKPKVVLDQKDCAFQPYVLPFLKDQALVIKSSDPQSHNVRFTGFHNTGINSMLGPAGTLELKLMAETHPMELHCDIHPWMKGWLLVLDHPFFATTGTDGSFEIKGVPAGDQNLIVWQARVGFANQGFGRGMPVKVSAGAVADVRDIKIDAARANK